MHGKFQLHTNATRHEVGFRQGVALLQSCEANSEDVLYKRRPNVSCARVCDRSNIMQRTGVVSTLVLTTFGWLIMKTFQTTERVTALPKPSSFFGRMPDK